MSDSDSDYDFVDIVTDLTDFIQKERLAAYNEGFKAGKSQSAVTCNMGYAQCHMLACLKAGRCEATID